MHFGERQEIKKKIVSTVLQKKLEKMVNIKELSDEHLRLQIREILQKKKEKLMALSKGVNRVELNKNIRKVTPEEIISKKVFLLFYSNYLKFF